MLNIIRSKFQYEKLRVITRNDFFRLRAVVTRNYEIISRSKEISVSSNYDRNFEESKKFESLWFSSNSSVSHYTFVYAHYPAKPFATGAAWVIVQLILLFSLDQPNYNMLIEYSLTAQEKSLFSFLTLGEQRRRIQGGGTAPLATP